MAAGKCASMSGHTLLLEKMTGLGRKLSITGKGRCNLTNVAPLDDIISHFGRNGRFLRQALSAFSSDDLLDLLHDLGIDTIVERGGRVFPESERAGDIVEGLVGWVKAQGVTIRARCPVRRLVVKGERIVGVEVGGETIFAENVIIATGGKSYPGTGSTGDGYSLAKAVGHSIIPVRSALVPLETAGGIAQRLQGLSLKNVTSSVYVDGKRKGQEMGEMIFTHFGLSGPIILTLSRLVVDALSEKLAVSVGIDLKPALDESKLDARLLRDFKEHGKQHYRTILNGLLPRKLIEVCIEQTAIKADRLGSQITSHERHRLKSWLKDLRFDVTGHRPWEEAIITAGGVNLKEVDPRTMASRLVSGLYFAGEVLDIDGTTGGYNLQAAFSTGWLAGTNAAE